MAINKKKNVTIQVTFPKEDAHNLQTLVNAFNKEGIQCSKSKVLLKSFREYLGAIILSSKIKNKQKDKVEEPQGEKQDA